MFAKMKRISVGGVLLTSASPEIKYVMRYVLNNADIVEEHNNVW